METNNTMHNFFTEAKNLLGVSGKLTIWNIRYGEKSCVRLKN